MISFGGIACLAFSLCAQFISLNSQSLHFTFTSRTSLNSQSLHFTLVSGMHSIVRLGGGGGGGEIIVW